MTTPISLCVITPTQVYAPCCPTCPPAGPVDCQHTAGRPSLPVAETALAGMPLAVLFCYPNLGQRQGQTGLYHSPCPLALQPPGSEIKWKNNDGVQHIRSSIPSSDSLTMVHSMCIRTYIHRPNRCKHT